MKEPPLDRWRPGCITSSLECGNIRVSLQTTAETWLDPVMLRSEVFQASTLDTR